MEITKSSFLGSLIVCALFATTYQQSAEAATQYGSGLPSAKAGQCFARVKKPAVYKMQSRQVLVNPATTKRVLVRQPQYNWVNKKVLVRKAMNKSYLQAARYKTVATRVMVKPAYETWREGHGAITRINNMTGQIMCRIKVPAVYKNKTKRVLAHPAKRVYTHVPAVYKTIKQKVQVAPALYKTVNTPARYKTQNYRVKASDVSYIWRPILCRTNSNKTLTKAKAVKPVAKSRIAKRSRAKPSVVKASFKVSKLSMAETKKIQEALKSKGFDPGEVDGQMGPGTAAAVYAFQKSRGLPVGQVTKDTSRALGLIR